MIGLDTNVLVRYFTGDDAVQSEQARSLIEGRLSADEPGYVNLVVLAEFVWTLARAYRFGNSDISNAVNALLDSTEIVVEREETVTRALGLVATANLDLVDALIASINMDAGCRETLTFDVRFAKSHAARLVG